MNLNELVANIPSLHLLKGGDKEIGYIYADSRKTGKNDIFCLNENFGSNSLPYLQAAAAVCDTVLVWEKSSLAAAARESFSNVILSEQKPETVLGEICSLLCGNPSLKMDVIGVTGTNGKTSITRILYDMFTMNGYKAGVIGTISVMYGDKVIDTGYTTPDSSTLNLILKEMAAHGVQIVLMEASSHGLNLGRLNGIHFKACLFTNLTRDHLDFHSSMEEYFNDKFKVFELLDQSQKKDKFALIAEDSPGGKEMLARTREQIRTRVISLGAAGDYRIGNVKLSVLNSGYTLASGQNEFSLQTTLLGYFNVVNSAMAVVTALNLGLDLEKIARSLARLQTVPGRFQILYNDNRTKTVIVDYAHTPDALENILQSVCEIQADKIYTVFGCGGDRDRSKRPLMAGIAEKYSTKVIITSDNPRTENPEAILDEIEQGFIDKRYERVADRRAAIRQAVKNMPEGGILVVAGKGHEDYQIIGREKFHFSDVEEVQNAFALIENNR